MARSKGGWGGNGVRLVHLKQFLRIDRSRLTVNRLLKATQQGWWEQEGAGVCVREGTRVAAGSPSGDGFGDRERTQLLVCYISVYISADF